MKRADTLIEVVEAAAANETFWAPALAGFLDSSTWSRSGARR